MLKCTRVMGLLVAMQSCSEMMNLATQQPLKHYAYPGGLQVGGGINSTNANTYIHEGASHVIVTSFVFNNGQVDFEKLKELAQVVGKQRLVLDLSCRQNVKSLPVAIAIHYVTRGILFSTFFLVSFLMFGVMYSNFKRSINSYGFKNLMKSPRNYKMYAC